MLNLLGYPETSAYKVSRIFREKEDSLIALMCREDNTRFVCRIYDHPVPGYRATGELAVPQLPATYRYQTKNGLCIVEEEFVDGISLTELMEVYRPDESQTAAIGERVCRALQALHEKGIIHRDVKPDNVLVTSEGRVVLIDLDAASQYDPEKERDTSLLGTAGYAAPEQFGFSRSDVRTDIFSLGVMLNVMMTGEHPSRTLADGKLRPIIERCIEVNADKRFSSARELGRRLAELAGEDEICPQCGCISPGGGCFCCGVPSARRKETEKKRPVIVALLCAAMICALILPKWLGGEKTDIPPSLPEQTQTIESHPEQLQTTPSRPEQSQTDQDTPPASAASPLPVPDGEKEGEREPEPENHDEQMPIYQGEYVWGNNMSQPFSILIDGEEQTVCMAVDYCSWTYAQKSDSRSIVLNDGEYIELTYGIGFFRQLEEGKQSRISGEERMDAVYERVGDSLKLEVLAYESSDRARPERFPEITEHTCSRGCFEGVTLRLGTENRGTYILRATALVDGEELVSEFRVEWFPTSEIRFTYDPAGGDMIDQINSFLAGVKYDEKYSVTVDIPAGTYEGQIVAPKIGLMYVRINGAPSDGAPVTVLKGGVDGQSHRTHISNIRFEGAGVGLEEIPAQWPDGRENIAFYGTGGGMCNRCEFEGYSAAIASTGRLKMGTNNLFQNNMVAFLIDTLYADGGSGMTGNEYRNNDIAVHFKSLNDNWPVTWFEMDNSRFVDNRIDLHNDLDRSITIANSYFADTINGVEVERECRVAQGE